VPTRTWEEVREDIYSLLHAATPTVLAGDPFYRPAEVRTSLTAWAEKSAGSAVFRAMELRFDSETMDDPGVLDNEVYEAETTGTLTIAYPADVGLYFKDDNDADLDNIDDVISADADLIQRTIGVKATSNLPTGVNGRWLLGRRVGRGEKVWFSVIPIRGNYRKTLT